MGPVGGSVSGRLADAWAWPSRDRSGGVMVFERVVRPVLFRVGGGGWCGVWAGWWAGGGGGCGGGGGGGGVVGVRVVRRVGLGVGGGDAERAHEFALHRLAGLGGVARALVRRRYATDAPVEVF